MESLKNEAINILTELQKVKPVAKYGISILDDYLHGIYEQDLVIITAATGAGKTHLAFDIAFNNAEKKNVILYALEADKNEPQLRFLYKIVADLYFNDPDRVIQDMSYASFVHNKVDISKYLNKASEIYASKNKPTIVYYDSNFTIENFKQNLVSTNKEYDLIVLDHLDYFDLMEDVSENQQMSNIMKTLRSINVDLHKPIVAISHLRKNTRKTLMPTVDDLMGSSNKGKLAKIIITLAPDKKGYTKDGMFPTFISVQKSRTGGMGNLIAKQVFDSKMNSYVDSYTLYNYNGYDDTVDELGKYDYPFWAKNNDIPFK